MKSERFLSLSHWFAFLLLGLYPVYASQGGADLPWAATMGGLAAAGLLFHLLPASPSDTSKGLRGILLMGLDSLLLSYLVYNSGGISSPLYPLLLLFAATGALLDRWTRSLLLASFICSAYLVACLAAGISFSGQGAHLLVNAAVLLGASVLLSYLANLVGRERGRAERIEALYNLSSQLMERINLGETLHHLLASATSIFHADTGLAFILDRSTGGFHLEASHPEESDAGRGPRQWEEDILERIRRQKRPFLADGSSLAAATDDLSPGPGRGVGIMAAPIMVGEKLFGSLVFTNRRGKSFTGQDLKLLATISNLAASAIARAELYQLVISRSEAIAGSMSSGLIITDPEGKVVVANQSCRDLLGGKEIPRESDLRELLEPALEEAGPLWNYLENGAGETGGRPPARMEVKLKGKPERILSVRISPIKAGYEPRGGYVVILEDITERVKVEEIRDDLMLLIARRLEEQAALYEVGKSMVDDAESGELLRIILEKAVTLVNADVGVLSSRREDGVFEVKAVVGMDQVNEGFTFSARDCLCYEAAAAMKPLRWTETEAESSAPWGSFMGGNISYMAAPISWQGELRGLIEVASSLENYIFSEDDLRLLGLFVNQAAVAIENANLYRILAEDQRRTEAMLHSIGDGVIAVDHRARIIMVNTAAERMLNLPPFSYAVNRHLKEVVRHPDLCNLLLRSLHNRIELEEEVHLPPPDSRIMEVETSLIETGSSEEEGIVAVIRDVTALRELEQAKSDFVSTVSHELRTPLTSIKAYTATLRRKDVDFDEETRQEFLRVVEEETDRLTRLISDLLDMSKIESGRMELNKREFDLAELVRIVCEKLRSQADKHRISIHLESRSLPVYADADKIEQVLVNLIDNAIKYSPQGGDVEVTLKVHRREAELVVTDHGVGIPEEHLPHIFEKFHRVDNRATREIYGTGLGLFVSKSIVEAHDGAIWAESVLGEGSTFHFTLPLSYRVSTADRRREERES